MNISLVKQAWFGTWLSGIYVSCNYFCKSRICLKGLQPSLFKIIPWYFGHLIVLAVVGLCWSRLNPCQAFFSFLFPKLSPAREASTEVEIQLKEKIRKPPYMVSKNLSVYLQFTTITMKATLYNMFRSERSQLAVMTHLPNSAHGNRASKRPMNVHWSPVSLYLVP